MTDVHFLPLPTRQPCASLKKNNALVGPSRLEHERQHSALQWEGGYLWTLFPSIVWDPPLHLGSSLNGRSLSVHRYLVRIQAYVFSKAVWWKIAKSQEKDKSNNELIEKTSGAPIINCRWSDILQVHTSIHKWKELNIMSPRSVIFHLQCIVQSSVDCNRLLKINRLS